MVSTHTSVWDLVPSQVLVEEVSGRYAIVRDFAAAVGGRVLSAVPGKPALVDCLVALFDEGEQGTRWLIP